MASSAAATAPSHELEVRLHQLSVTSKIAYHDLTLVTFIIIYLENPAVRRGPDLETVTSYKRTVSDVRAVPFADKPDLVTFAYTAAKGGSATEIDNGLGRERVIFKPVCARPARYEVGAASKESGFWSQYIVPRPAIQMRTAKAARQRIVAVTTV